MVAYSWLNNDGLTLQVGTQKTIPDPWGDYVSYGANRVIEGTIDLTSLSTSPQIQSETILFPFGTGIFVEEVQLISEVASAGGTSFSVGLGYPSGSTYGNITTNFEASGGATPALVSPAYTGSYVGVTAISNTAFVNAMINASTNTLGDKITINVGSTSAGGYIGQTSTATTRQNYITALAAGTYTAGIIRVRIIYHGVGVISQ